MKPSKTTTPKVAPDTGADPLPKPVRAAFDVLYFAARKASLTADDHDAVRQAVGTLNQALTQAYAPKEPALAVPPETPA